MKVNRHGKARCLSKAEIRQLFDEGLQTQAHRCLFGICLYTGARINESCTLQRADVFDLSNRIRPELIIRKNNTKGKLATRCLPINADLMSLLKAYNPAASANIFLFPGRHGRGHLRADCASRILQIAFTRVGIEGASTHSFRRTALTMMSNRGVLLRVIQAVSGHRSLDVLSRYLTVEDDQLKDALATLELSSYAK